MTCPRCAATIEPVAPPYGQAALALLKDWRVWAFAVAASLVAGILSGALGLGAGAGAGSGAATGLFIALRMGRLRRCTACNAVFDAPPAPKAPAS